MRWLGFDWGKHLYHASDYFERLYEWAEQLIRAGKAYVDDQTPEEMRVDRGTLTEPGRNSPFRDRSVEENLDLFRRMKAGEFPNGARVLRAKIDMASGNINLRDPVLYRILQGAASAHRHHVVDLSELRLRARPVGRDRGHHAFDLHAGIRGSPAALRLVPGKPAGAVAAAAVRVRAAQPHLHDAVEARADRRWCATAMSRGWDDPRMPTLAGLRRRGVPPEALRDFVKRIGVAKANSIVDAGMFDFSIRETLNKTALRRMAVLRPLKVVIENYPEGQSEELDAVNHPDDPAAGTRKIKFGRELYIEQDDFMENPPKKFFRLSPGAEVRLRYAYFITCREVGEGRRRRGGRAALHLRSGDAGRQRAGRPQGEGDDPLGVGGARAVPPRCGSTIRCSPSPIRAAANFTADLNPNSLEVLGERADRAGARRRRNSAEPVQFERQGYFVRDPDSTPRPSGVQPHRRTARHLRQGGRRRADLCERDPGRAFRT